MVEAAIGNQGRWTDLLAAMEAGLAEPGRTPLAWQPPVDLGPLPASLVARAAVLVGELEAAKLIVTGERDDAARQLRALESVPRPASATSVYLDVTG